MCNILLETQFVTRLTVVVRDESCTKISPTFTFTCPRELRFKRGEKETPVSLSNSAHCVLEWLNASAICLYFSLSFFFYFTSFCLALDETEGREHLFSFLATSLVATQETLDMSRNYKRKRIKYHRLTWRSLLLRNRAGNSKLRSNPVGTQKTHNNWQQPFHEVTARSATKHRTE